jgi:hypothetical protein
MMSPCIVQFAAALRGDRKTALAPARDSPLENTDPHYSLLEGFVCDQTGHCLEGAFERRP